MTVLVGVLCKGGVVIGADSSATFAGAVPTIEQPTKKIEIISEKVIVAGTGQVGLGQRFNGHVEAMWSNNSFKKTRPSVEIMTELCSKAVNDFAATKVEKGQFGALVAFPSGKGAQLCEFAVRDLQPELKTERMWFVSMGSGQAIADPFLGLLRRVFWKDTQPKLNEGIFAVAWALQNTIDLNTGGIKGPPKIAVLSESGATFVDDDQLAEHLDNIQGAEDYLSKYVSSLAGQGGKELPV